MDAAAFRSQFPVCATVAYFNAGTDGPLPSAAGEAATEAVRLQLVEGRSTAHFERRHETQEALRAGYARLLGRPVAEVSVTSGTSEGMAKVLAGMDLGRGDEILTSDAEHPGLLGPLIAARRRGVAVRTAPLARIHEAVSSATTVVACSHVGWITGDVAPAELAELDVPVVLDGAQGAGAVPTDPAALGCVAYAAAGQKWLCGADGTGLLWIAPELGDRVAPVLPAYGAFVDPAAGLDADLHRDARAHDAASLPLEAVAASLAALETLEAAGHGAVAERAAALAGELAARLERAGRTVGPRGATTLVAWEDPDPPATRERLADAGVVLRHLPGTPYVRASVGAWNDASDVERLLAAL